VVGRVHVVTADGDPGLWLDADDGERGGFTVPVDLPIWQDPVPREALLADDRLRDLEVLRQPQLANPLFVTPEQLAVIEEYRSLPPLQVGVGSGGAGFGDPVSRVVVEKAAEDVVKRHYRRRGWKVEDVSKQNLGWTVRARHARASPNTSRSRASVASCP